jgi:exodeoxyribonuclease-3
MQELKVVDEEFPADAFRAIGYEVALVGQKTYNGVAIASRLPMVEVQRGLDDGEDDPQARLVAATITTPGGPVRVMSVYAPNGQSVGSDKYGYKLAWYRRLRRHLDGRYAARMPLVVAGDFNVAPGDLDVHDPKAWAGQILCSDDERAALRELCAFGLVDVYRAHHPEGGRYTWWDYRMLSFPKNLGLRIDHVLATPALAERCVSAEIDRDARKGKQPSDHAPVVVEFSE